MIKRIFIICLIAAILYPQFVFATVSSKADKVVVIKSKRVMMLLKDGDIIKTYKVSLGKNPVGPKDREGDNKTPEGNYILDSRNLKSKYYLAIHISYPNDNDIINAQRAGVPPGGGIMIHGLPKELEELGKFHRNLNWTNGCVAVTNTEIEEIWQLIADGTQIEIKP
ncbi:MAG: L,D-transpeptidase family protein [Thermodesulfovibrionales bacterium]|nr:L,D-transpeptidase family protein [Thermodesulfovibrionales bacterium]